ncbi:MAG: polysaccharide biosynthesis/export family protein [Desulfobacterales bacterium]
MIILLIVLMAGAATGQEKPVMPGMDYIIGPGDILDISVWKVEELTKLVTVLPDGKIAFPLVKQVGAAGKTVDQLTRELEAKLIRYVPDLNLSILVHQVNSMMVYVIGRVNNPGRFILNSNIDVLQALTLAGGLNPFAEGGKIKIFRKQPNGTEIIRFDYDDVIKGKDLAQNITLIRGDVIVVP